MTVIKRLQQSCEYPIQSNSSDADSLELYGNTTSDTDSIISDVINFRNPYKLRKSILFEECLHRKGYVGKRKRRLCLNNGIILQTITEDEEIKNGFVQLMDDYKSPFERLMENQTALQFWNEFNELSEEDQNSIISPNKDSRICSVSREASSPRISSKVKRAMKIKKNVPLELLADMENKLLQHFDKSLDLYTISPKNSYERLMLHAIAHYHGLQSIGVNGTWPLSIQVFPSDNKWKPSETLFYDTIQQLLLK